MNLLKIFILSLSNGRSWRESGVLILLGVFALLPFFCIYLSGVFSI